MLLSMTRKRVVHLGVLILATLVGAGLFVFFLHKSGVSKVAESLISFGALPFLVFCLISLANFSLYVLRWQVILNAMHTQRIPFGRLFLHRMSGFATGYLTPSAPVASEPIRAALLVSDGVPVQEATGSIVLDLAFEITTFIVYALTGVIVALTQEVYAAEDFLIPFGFVGVLLMLLFTFFVQTVRGRGSFSHVLELLGFERSSRLSTSVQWVRQMEKLMAKFFAGRTRLVAYAIVLSIGMMAMRGVEMSFIAHFLGTDLSLRDALLMSTLPGLVLFLPVPGGLGLYEGSNAAMFALLGLPLDPVAFTMVIRLRDALFIAIGASHALRSGERWLLKPKV